MPINRELLQVPDNLDNHGGGLGLDLIDVTDHVERTLGKIIMLTVDDLLETVDGFFEADELTGGTGEDLSNVEGLGHELLYLTCAGDDELIVLGKLVHTKNGDNVLKALVILKDLLSGTGNLVVLVTDNTGVKHTGGGVEGIDGGVDTKFGNSTGQDSGSVKMGEGGGGGRIGKIIGRDVDSLDGGNGTLGGGGNTLLETTHISGQGGLVTDSGRDTSKKGGHLGTGLGETEDVVNEEEHILSLLVTEVLSDRETGKCDTGTGTRGFVHLTVHKGSLGSFGGTGSLIDLDDTTFNHLVVQIVTLTGTLADAGEDGVTTVVHGNVVNELHDNDGLTDTGTAEETDLTTLGVGGEKVDDLDAGDKNLLGLTLLGEGGGSTMEGGELLRLLVGEDGALLVDGLTNDVDDTAKSLGTDGDLDGGAGVVTDLATDETISGLHGNGTDGVLAKMLGDLKD
mmetsp:Transcript_29205/g.63386  ORF Transcript_29205/g.63386 Transcript_29205/m.63386 type:complete len:454 (+) Transcript_29205:182-1543(+)